VRACVRACVRAWVHAGVWYQTYFIFKHDFHIKSFTNMQEFLSAF